MAEVRQSQVSGEDNDQPKGMDPRSGICPRHNNLKQRKKAIQSMLTYIGELRVGIRPPRTKEYSPIYDGDEERVGGDGRVEEGMQCLQRAWERAQDGAAS